MFVNVTGTSPKPSNARRANSQLDPQPAARGVRRVRTAVLNTPKPRNLLPP